MVRKRERVAKMIAPVNFIGAELGVVMEVTPEWMFSNQGWDSGFPMPSRSRIASSTGSA
jgi:hypothetical protein